MIVTRLNKIEMETNRRKSWIFSLEKLNNSPSFQDGMDNEMELRYRQKAAKFIQYMGNRLNVYDVLFS